MTLFGEHTNICLVYGLNEVIKMSLMMLDRLYSVNMQFLFLYIQYILLKYNTWNIKTDIVVLK